MRTHTLARRAFFGLASAASFAALAIALVHCGDDEGTPNTTPIDGSTLDVSSPDSSSQSSDSGNPITTDSGADTGTADSGPPVVVYDDAGCSIPNDPLPSAADAGIPSNGLVLWLRADRGIGSTDAGVVCRWIDQSGSNHSFDANDTNRPTIAPASLRGKPAITFSSDTVSLSRAGALDIPPTSARTVAVFGSTADTTHRFNYFYQGDTNTNDKYFGLDQNTFNTVGSREGVYVTGNAYDSNLATSTAPRSHVYAIDDFTVGGTILDLVHYDIDGVATTLVRTNGGTGNGKVETLANVNKTWIGLGRPGFTGGTLGEMLVYSRSLTTVERAALNTYFQARFPQ